MILSEWLEVWLTTYKIPYLKLSSINRINTALKNHIPLWLKNKSITDITVMDLDKSLSEIELSRTRKYCYYILHNSLYRAYCLGFIKDNVAQKMLLVKHKQRRGKALNKTEQVKFLKAIEKSPYKNAFKFLLFSGVRRGELERLEYKDVYELDNLILIRGTKTETSERYIILTNELKEIIREQREVHPFANVIFPYPADTLTHHFKKYCPGHKLHDLRHTFITRCAESGININVTQNLVGHKTLNTTLAIYTHISQEFLKEEFKKFKI